MARHEYVIAIRSTSKAISSNFYRSPARERSSGRAERAEGERRGEPLWSWEYASKGYNTKRGPKILFSNSVCCDLQWRSTRGSLLFTCPTYNELFEIDPFVWRNEETFAWRTPAANNGSVHSSKLRSIKISMDRIGWIEGIGSLVDLFEGIKYLCEFGFRNLPDYWKWEDSCVDLLYVDYSWQIWKLSVRKLIGFEYRWILKEDSWSCLDLYWIFIHPIFDLWFLRLETRSLEWNEKQKVRSSCVIINGFEIDIRVVVQTDRKLIHRDNRVHSGNLAIEFSTIKTRFSM